MTQDQCCQAQSPSANHHPPHQLTSLFTKSLTRTTLSSWRSYDILLNASLSHGAFLSWRSPSFGPVLTRRRSPVSMSRQRSPDPDRAVPAPDIAIHSPGSVAPPIHIYVVHLIPCTWFTLPPPPMSPTQKPSQHPRLLDVPPAGTSHRPPYPGEPSRRLSHRGNPLAADLLSTTPSKPTSPPQEPTGISFSGPASLFSIAITTGGGGGEWSRVIY